MSLKKTRDDEPVAVSSGGRCDPEMKEREKEEEEEQERTEFSCSCLSLNVESVKERRILRFSLCVFVADFLFST